MDSPPDSPSRAGPRIKMDKILLVVVAGLRDNGDDAEFHYAWEENWLSRMGISDCHVIQFDAGLNRDTKERDILSPDWFERAAKKLLDEVKSKQKEENRLVFFGENLGGIVLKRALMLANTAEGYASITRDTCACVLLGVPHTVPSPEAWNRILIGLLIPFWRSLPLRFWSSTAALPEFLSRTSSDFVQIAFRMGIITVYRHGIIYNDGFRIDRRSVTVLNLSHERLLEHSLLSQNTEKFSMYYDDDRVKVIFQDLRKTAAVKSESREYFRMLSQLSPHTRIPESSSIQPVVNKVREYLDPEKVLAVVLTGSRGTGKGALSYHVYKSLLLQRKPSEIVTYFAFDARDYRRQSVSAMLIKIIEQLLACEPELIDSIQRASADGDQDIRWTEGNLWIQLRFIIRQAKCDSIKIVIDSVTDCKTENVEVFQRSLFNLRFAAPNRLKILCTAVTGMSITLPEGVDCIEICSLSEFKDNWVGHLDSLTSTLASENPKLEAAKAQIKQCLEKSESFLHSSLITHRIRTISSLSSLDSVVADLAKLGISWKETIIEMVSGAPSWVATAVSWMLFARRPLRPTELAVAVTLKDWSTALNPDQELDDQIIPRDMEDDLRRQLGPLVRIERGEIRISHVYIGEVLEDRLKSTKDGTTPCNMMLTKQLTAYLRNCLRKIIAKNHKQASNELRFSLLEYALEHWHVHYREAMADAARLAVPRSAEKLLEDLALSLLRTTEYRSWLQRANPATSKPRTQTQEAEDVPNAVSLASKFGLLDIVKSLVSKDMNSERVTALRIACQYGHPKIVEHLIDGFDEIGDIQLELTKACKRGDEAIAVVILDRYKKIQGSDVPSDLLPEVCRIGHTDLVEKLISKGAKARDPAANGALPLHMAVDQGHLDIVELLLTKGADAMALFDDKSTPLQRSIKRGYRHVSKRLLQESNLRDTPNVDGVTALHLAAGTGDVDLLEQILLKLYPPKEAKSQLRASETTDGRSEMTNLGSPLHEAAANGHVGAVKVLLAHKFDINATDSRGRSALFLALSKDHREVVDHLFEECAEITFGKVYADSALKQAIIYGNESAAELLIERNPDINAYNGADDSPLTEAARMNHTNIVGALLNAEANTGWTVNHEADEEIFGELTKGAWTAAHFAAYYGRTEVMRLLMSKCPDIADSPTKSGHRPLHLAVFKEHVAIVDTMIPRAKAAANIRNKKNRKASRADLEKERKRSITRALPSPSSSTPQSKLKGVPLADFYLDFPTENGLTALHIAVANGNIEIAKMLILSGAAPGATDIAGKGVVHFAATARKNATEMVRFLSQYPVDVDLRDSEGKTPLYYAVEGSDEDMVILLLEHGSNPNAAPHDGNTPLYVAAAAGKRTLVRRLIKYQADVNTKVGNEGYTALHAAASSGDKDMTTLLIDSGANIHAVNDQRDTPLHEAARHGNVNVVTLLLNAHADINAVNTRRITPLQRAVLNQWSETAAELLRNAADPNIRDEDGDTALMAAMYSEQLDIVKLLLDDKVESQVLKADPNVLNSSDKTPLMLALRLPQICLPLLIKAKADVTQCGDNKITVLHMVASEANICDVEDVRLLLQYGKDHLNIKDAEGLAPIHHAARSGRKRMMQEFHACGAEMVTRDAQGRTAMHHAVHSIEPTDFAEVFSEFLHPNKGNCVNVPDDDGWMPLHWACKSGSLKIVELLLEKCETDEARKNMILQKGKTGEGKHGWTALATAQFQRQTDIIEVLTSALGLAITNLESEPIKLGLTSMPDNSKGASELDPSDIQPVKPGVIHPYVTCDDCSNTIYGVRFKCKNHYNFDLCFKCYWHYKESHFPRGHEFLLMGEGPTEGPIFLDPPQPLSSPPLNSPVEERAAPELSLTATADSIPLGIVTSAQTTHSTSIRSFGSVGAKISSSSTISGDVRVAGEASTTLGSILSSPAKDNTWVRSQRYLIDTNDGEDEDDDYVPMRVRLRQRQEILRSMMEDAMALERELLARTRSESVVPTGGDREIERGNDRARNRDRRSRSRSHSRSRSRERYGYEDDAPIHEDVGTKMGTGFSESHVMELSTVKEDVSLGLVSHEPPAAARTIQSPDQGAKLEGSGSGAVGAAAKPDSSEMASALFSKRQGMEVEIMTEKMREDMKSTEGNYPEDGQP